MLNIRTQLCYIIWNFYFFLLTFLYTSNQHSTLCLCEFKTAIQSISWAVSASVSCLLYLHNSPTDMMCSALWYKVFFPLFFKIPWLSWKHLEGDQRTFWLWKECLQGFQQEFSTPQAFLTLKNFFVTDSTLMFPKISVPASNFIESNLVPHHEIFYNLYLCQGSCGRFI